jgi:hypothetical protein
VTARIGDTVHYVSYGTPGGEFPSVCRAATVTEVGDGDVRGLCVVNPTGLFFHPLAAGGCKYGTAIGGTPGGGTWHWIEECDPDGQTLTRNWSAGR